MAPDRLGRLCGAPGRHRVDMVGLVPSDERRATSDPNLSGGMPRARAYLRIVAVGLALTVFALVMYLKTG